MDGLYLPDINDEIPDFVDGLAANFAEIEIKKANKKTPQRFGLTLVNGWGGTIWCQKTDVGVVSIFTGTALVTGNPRSSVIATVPEGFRPTTRGVRGLVQKGNLSPYDTGMAVELGVNGNITIVEPLRSLLTEGHNDGLHFRLTYQTEVD